MTQGEIARAPRGARREGPSAGGPYEGGVVLSTQSAGFLGAVFDGY